MRSIRVAWVILAVVVLGLNAASIPYTYAEYSRACTLDAEVCFEEGLLTPEDARQLREFGISPELEAAYSSGLLPTVVMLVYATLTAMLVLVYVIGVVGLQHLLSPHLGEDNQLAIVASTLAIAALFGPLRRRIQTTIDRRFYRNKYDDRRTLEDFSTRLPDETDLERLNADLLSVVRDTMQPEHASLWLRPPRAWR